MSGKKTDKQAQFDSRAVFKRLQRYLFEHKTVLGFAIAFMVFTALTEATFAYMIKPIINNGFVNAEPWHVKWMALIVMGLMTLRSVVGYFANYYMARLGRYVIYGIRQDVFARLITLPTTYFDDNSSAKNVSKLIYDAETAAVATTDTLTILFKDSVLALALRLCGY